MVGNGVEKTETQRPTGSFIIINKTFGVGVRVREGNVMCDRCYQLFFLFACCFLIIKGEISPHAPQKSVKQNPSTSAKPRLSVLKVG